MADPVQCPNPTLPRISVVAVTPDNYQTIRKSVHALRAQTICSDLELIVVAPSREALHLDEGDLQCFHSHSIVEIGPIGIMGAAREAGVRAARGDFVSFVEDHAYPDPDWAAAQLVAHAAGNVAVGSLMHNANPGSMTSWADLFLGFTPWVEPRKAGPATRLPWHHTGYDRAILLSQGDHLASVLETEGVFHAKLHSEGRLMYLTDSKTSHVNISRFSSFLIGQYHGGRSFGGHRAQEQGWPWYRRLMQAMAAPIVPLMRRAPNHCGGSGLRPHQTAHPPDAPHFVPWPLRARAWRGGGLSLWGWSGRAAQVGSGVPPRSSRQCPRSAGDRILTGCKEKITARRTGLFALPQ